MLTSRAVRSHPAMQWFACFAAMMVAVLAGLGAPWAASGSHTDDPPTVVVAEAAATSMPHAERPVVPDQCCHFAVDVGRPAMFAGGVVLDSVTTERGSPTLADCSQPGLVRTTDPPRAMLQVWRC